MELWRALGLGPGDVAAFTGGGGKTALAVRLALQTGSLFTTTTRIRAPAEMPVWLVEEQGFPSTLPPGPYCVAARRMADGKLMGVAPALVERLRSLSRFAVLVEADGSAGLPLKAPAPHEPVIPPCATLVVAVAGASAFGRPVGQMHRPAYLAAAAGVGPEAPVTGAVVAAALRACARGAPAEARLVAVVNQCDLLEDLSPAREALAGFGRGVLTSRGEPVGVTGAVAAVVLAAGGARRFGGGKQLASWRGKTLLEHALTAPLQAGLREVVVVEGATVLAHLLAPYPVRRVHNPDWAEGMSTSLRTGLSALSPDVQAVLFCLADQPLLPPEVVRRLVLAWGEGAQIAAPYVGGERRNPVLFDRSLFAELMASSGDEGGRPVLRRHPDLIVPVPWHDPAVFADIDTVADLQGLR